MKPSSIQAGKTYTNRGAGKTRRYVSEIIKNPTDEQRPRWYGFHPRPDEPVVVYQQDNGKETRQSSLYISSFAAWAGKEIE